VRPLARGGWPYLSHKTVAFDVPILAYKYMSILSTRDPATLQTCMKDFARKCLRFHVDPIFVFDGKAPQAKAAEIARRQEAMRKAEAKGSYAMFHPSGEHFAAIRSAIESCGVPCVRASEEGEGECAMLSRRGFCDVVVTNDSDSLAYLAREVVFQFDSSRAYAVHLDDVLTGMNGMSRETFVDYCVLMGTDNNPRIKGVGEARLWADMVDRSGAQARNIEELIRCNQATSDAKFSPAALSEFMDSYKVARKIFLTGYEAESKAAMGACDADETCAWFDG